jgi:hypothetical protein
MRQENLVLPVIISPPAPARPMYFSLFLVFFCAFRRTMPNCAPSRAAIA